MSQDGLNQSNISDPEVVPRAKRRRFSAEYKLRILEEADACGERGQIGSLLRREGLYSSHLTTWRQQREQGQLEALSPKNRDRKPTRPLHPTGRSAAAPIVALAALPAGEGNVITTRRIKNGKSRVTS